MDNILNMRERERERKKERDVKIQIRNRERELTFNLLFSPSNTITLCCNSMTNSLCPLPRPPTEGALTTGWNALLLLGGTVDDACIWKNYHKIIHHIHCTCMSHQCVRKAK